MTFDAQAGAGAFVPGVERITLICRCGLLVESVVMVWRQWAHRPECQHTPHQRARAAQLAAARRWHSLWLRGQVRRHHAAHRPGRKVISREW